MKSTRSIIALALVLLATAAFAGEGTPAQQQPLATGYVASVNSETGVITIHGGNLRIATSGAEFRGPNGTSSLSAITPGALIAVVFHPGSYTNGQAVPAKVVQILDHPVTWLTMTGQVESVDLTARTLTLYGQTIRVTDRTRFGGSVASVDPKALQDLKVGQPVTVSLSSLTEALIADDVYAIAPASPDQFMMVTGIVKRIRGDVWELSRASISSFKVIRRTTIDPMIRVGSLVRATVRIDDNEATAVAISLMPQQCPNFVPNPVFTVRGFVTEVSATSMLVKTGQNDYRITLNDETRWSGPDPKVGNNVIVEVEKIGNNYVARQVDTVEHAVEFFIFDTLTAIDGNQWTVAGYKVTVNAETVVIGSPKVGDIIIVSALRQPGGEIVAKHIQKDPRQ